MHIITTILIALAAIIALVFIIALFIKKEHYAKTEIIINAPRQKVFDFLKFVGNQKKFNKQAMTDPDRSAAYKGTDGTVGFVYSWSGDKDAGEGAKEIIEIVDGKRIEMEIRFVKPMKAVGRMVMETETVAGDNTKVSWSNRGLLPYPLNIFVPMVEKNVSKDMATSLITLKNILEQES